MTCKTTRKGLGMWSKVLGKFAMAALNELYVFCQEKNPKGMRERGKKKHKHFQDTSYSWKTCHFNIIMTPLSQQLRPQRLGSRQTSVSCNNSSSHQAFFWYMKNSSL